MILLLSTVSAAVAEDYDARHELARRLSNTHRKAEQAAELLSIGYLEPGIEDALRDLARDALQDYPGISVIVAIYDAFPNAATSWT